MRQSGFTLTELLMGMAIAAVVAMLAIPTLGSLLESSRLTSTTNAFVEAFMTARSEAVKRGVAVRVIPGDGAVGFRVVLASNEEDVIRTFDNEASSAVVIKFSEEIDFVEYQPNGARTGGASALNIFVCNKAGTKGRRIGLGVTGGTQVEQVEGTCP